MSEPSSTIPEDDTFENYSPEYNSWEPSDNCDFKNLAL
uniref:Uma2 family endonuclease n=1 Tax=Globodera pallida TaxID=36090 RepID=A0A183CTD4_GLOPA